MVRTDTSYTQVLMPVYAWNNKKSDNTTEAPFNVLSGSSNHIKANRDFYNYTASFNGTSGVGRGLLAARPSTCTVNTAYFATDVGVQGTLYKCMATNTWTKYYEPYTYPHPLRGVTPRPKHTIGVGATMRLNEGATISIQ